MFLMPLMSMAQLKTGFTIKGTVKGLNTQVSLLSAVDGKTIITDKAANGVFTLKGKLTAPNLLQINFAGSKEGIDLFIGNDEVTITGDLADLKNVKIAGSAVEKEYLDFKQEFYPLFEKLNNVGNLLKTEQDATKKNGLMQEYTSLRTNILNASQKFITDKSASPVSSLLLVAIIRLFEGPDELEAKYAQLKPAAKSGPFAAMIEKNDYRRKNATGRCSWNTGA